MKQLLFIISLLCSSAAFSQKIGWTTIAAQNNYINGAKVNKLYLQPQPTLLTTSPDTASAIIYNVDTVTYMFYKGKNIRLSGGSTTTTTGSNANSFEDAFTGASNSYNVGKTPIAGTVKVFVNGVKLPADSYSVTGNTVLVNTSVLSFTLSVQDRVDINYQSTFQTGLQQ
jgi:hypothetical protein